MKYYEKQYENVFDTPRREHAFKLEKVSNSLGLSNRDYADLSRVAWMDMSKVMFESVVKTRWIMEQYKYGGKFTCRKITGDTANTFQTSVFFEKIGGFDTKILTKSAVYTMIAPFIKSMFPEFHRHNPFTDVEYFAYPYKWITLDYFGVVHDMYERLDLLALAEEKKMMFREFSDYVINHALCVNEEKGRNAYEIIETRGKMPFFIKNNLNKRKTYEGKKTK